MSLAPVVDQMARKKSPVRKSADRPKRNDVATKIDIEVSRKVKIVAAYRNVSAAEYLSDLVAPLVARDLEAEQTKDARRK